MRGRAALLLALLGAPLGGQDPLSIVGRAGRIYRNLSSLQADFVQIIEDRAQGDTLTSRGVVTQAGDNHFAMWFSDPAGEAVVVDGKYIWTYTPSTAPNQVYRRLVPTDPVYGVNLLAQLLDRPHDRYRASYVNRDTVAGRATDVIDLVPNDDDLGFRRARIWLGVDDALPRRIELEEAGARRILILSKLRPNISISRKTFTFQPPAGVRIIDRT